MRELTLFLAGDVMTGRGIDQILNHPGDSSLREPSVKDAGRYVTLAEDKHGAIPRAVDPSYTWGFLPETLATHDPDIRVVNLETSVTRSDDFSPRKKIHYRMHPGNVDCLTALDIDVCVLSNNHVLDFGRSGLRETLSTLESRDIQTTGAGLNEDAATAPEPIEVEPNRRLLILGAATESSGVPGNWAADGESPGVHLLEDLSTSTARQLAARISRARKPGDRVLVSLHWGKNWGFEVPEDQRFFARTLIDSGTVDLVHGHSSHHVKGIEVHRGRLILYGCGDFVTDYEGISGHEKYRGDLGLAYLPTLEAETGKLNHLNMIPTQLRQFQLRRPEPEGLDWLGTTLSRESAKFDTGIRNCPDGTLELKG